MRRFDKSILGLMEQCDSGKWVPYEDIPDHARMVESYEQQIRILQNNVDRANAGVDTWKNIYHQEVQTSQKLSSANAVMSALLLITILISIGGLSILTAMLQHST
jgi:hypothetical protein